MVYFARCAVRPNCRKMVPPPDQQRPKTTRPDGTSLLPGPKTHPRITPSNVSTFASGAWKRFLLRRAPPPGYLRGREEVYFSPLSFSYAWSKEHSMELRAFGTTSEGFSMCVRVIKFPPYFFARLPEAFKKIPQEEADAILRDYSRYLNTHLRAEMPEWDRKKIGMSDRVVHADATHVEEHFPTPVFAGKITEPFARIYLVHPVVVRPARVAIEFPYGGEGAKDGRKRARFLPDAFRTVVPETGFQPYEADLDYVVRFLTDMGLSASAWWRIDKRATEMLGNSRATTCNLELLVDPGMLSSNVVEEVATTVAPYIRSKLDIEVETSTRFPQPENSRVILIALRNTLGDVDPQKVADMVRTPMADGEYIRVGKSVNIALCLGTVRPQADFVPICFDTEEDMLWAYHELYPVLDIDDTSGQYTSGFDHWFLMERAKHLGLKSFRFTGRVPGESMYSNVNVEKEKREAMRKKKFAGPLQARQDQYMTKIPGVCVWDFLFYAVAFVRKATSYSLNALAAQFLKDKQKLDVEYSLIAKMQQTLEGRTQLASYCDRDVLLVQLLDNKVGASAFLRELSDLTYVPRQSLLDRKSVFRATARWVYEAQRYDKEGKGRRYLMPTKSIRIPLSKAAKAKADALAQAEADFRQGENGDGTPDDPMQGVKPTPPPILSGGSAGSGDCVKRAMAKMQSVLSAEDVTSVATPGKVIRASAAEKKMVKYSGGTVMEPCTGYYKDLITVFDFMSLYPSIMRWRNICYVTILPPGQQDALMTKHGLTEDDVWHAPLYELSPDGMTTVARICKATMPSFVKNKVMEGILPYIERTFADLRGQKKKCMGACFTKINELLPDGLVTLEQRKKLQVLAAIYNNQQECIKIFMNSLYGVMGAVEATFPLRDGARTVTSEARQAIEVARHNAETMFPAFLVDVDGEWRKMYELFSPEHTHERVQEFIRTFNERKPEEGLPFKPEVVYGDSVPGDCPVVVRSPMLNETYVIPIGLLCPDDLFRPWHGDKERGVFDFNLEVLVDGGFTPIQAVVRHKVGKPLVETRTTSAVVVTTEDHSLINANLLPVPPRELQPGANLAVADLSNVLSLNNTFYLEEDTAMQNHRVRRAAFLGILFAHGRLERCVVHGIETDSVVVQFRGKISDAEDVMNMAHTELAKATMTYSQTPHGSNPHRRYNHTITFRPMLRANMTFADDLRGRFANLVRYTYNGKAYHKVPADILNGSLREKKAFLEGVSRMHVCGETRTWQAQVKDRTYVVRGSVAAQGMLLMLRMFHTKVSVERMWNAELAEETYVLQVGERSPQHGRPGTLLHVRDVPQTAPQSQYVYDLVTEKQRYCAGVGDAVVHNTDSIFVRYRFFVSDDPDADDLTRIMHAEKYNDYMAAELSKVYATDTMVLQFEKICTRAYLITKKKYMLRMWLRQGGKYAMQIKESGTCGVRRDGCNLQRIMCAQVNKALMEDSDPEAAIESVRSVLAYVMSGKATLDEVLMCSTISQPIANYDDPGPPHVELARKEMRAGARPYNKGDRVYFIVVGGLKKDAIRDRVRTPQDAIENDIPYCKEYYGLSVILNQARILLGPLVDTRSYDDKRAFQDWARRVGFEEGGAARITAAKKQFKDAMNRAVDKLILYGLPLEATRILENSTIESTFGREPAPCCETEDDVEDISDGEPELPETEDDEPTDGEDSLSSFAHPPHKSAPGTSACTPATACTPPGTESAASTSAGEGAKRPRPADLGDSAVDTPPGKRQKTEPAKKPGSFFGACFKYGGDGGVSAAFKSKKSVGAAQKMRVVKTVPKSSPLFANLVVYDKCIGCNETVPASRGYICAACEKEQPTLRRDRYSQQLAKTNALEKEYNARWNKCQQCRGRMTPHADRDQCEITHCVNYVCPNWGRRQTVTRDLRKSHATLTKLGLEFE